MSALVCVLLGSFAFAQPPVETPATDPQATDAAAAAEGTNAEPPSEPAAEHSAPPRRETPSVEMVRADAPPIIDGVLDDAAWQRAAVISDFKQVEPDEGMPPTEKTEIRLLYDDNALYIAFRCFDSEPDKIIAKQMQRDGDFASDDWIAFVIDPFADQRNGYLFQMGPAGGKRDALVEAFRRGERVEWDAIWEGKSRVDEQGWTAEFAIPFKSISMNPRADTWGFNAQRVIRHKQERVRWASPRRNVGLQNLSEAGRLTNLAGMSQGFGLSIEPFVSARVDLEDGGLEIRPGADLFYKITPSTTAAVTVNTDFAEAEVDDRRVNLTRFPLFFPEKRDFFLQDAGVFNFGGINFSPLPFFSRRIGIVDGEQKDILAGVRITGRERGVSFGLLDVEMYDDRDLGSKNHAVGRVSLDILEQSNVGFIFTNGDPGTRGDNTLGGADFNYRTSSFLGDNVLEGHAWIMGTTSSEESRVGEEDDTAMGGRITYPNDDWNLSLFAAHIGESFNPALGFVERTGVREYNANARYRWRPGGYLRRIDLSANPSLFTGLDSELETLELEAPELEFENRFGDTWGLAYIWNQDVLEEDFEIADGVFIDEDDYTFGRVRAGFDAAASRVIAPEFEYETGDFYDGSRSDYTFGLSLRPGATFFGSVEYELNDVDLPSGDFIVRIIRARANFFFTPEISWSNTIQYDNVSDRLGANSRVRWELKPGTEIFVVLNHGFEVEDDSFRSEQSELTVKLGLTFRF